VGDTSEGNQLCRKFDPFWLHSAEQSSVTPQTITQKTKYTSSIMSLYYDEERLKERVAIQKMKSQ
jgi:hypothetical protein